MYRAMLVDDDVPVLEFLTKLVPWERLGLTLCGAFENGRLAYEAAQKTQPDLLITDIGMPQMDGIELIRRLKEANPRMAVVILSCHDEFRYAQQAIQLNVDDYVLKESVQPDSFAETIVRAVGRLKERQQNRVPFSAGDSANAPSDMSVLKERFIRSTLYNPLIDREDWMRKAEFFGVDLRSMRYVPAIMTIDRYSETKARFFSEENFAFAVENVVDELLQNEQNAVSFRLSHRETAFLFGMPPTLKVNGYALIDQTIGRIRSALNMYLKTGVSFAVGEPSDDPVRLREAMFRMAEGADERFYWDECSVNRYKETPFSPDDLFVHYAEAAEQFRQIVVSQAIQDVAPVVRFWVERVRARRYRPEMVKEFFLKIFLDLHVKFKTLQYFPSAYSQEALHRTFLEIDNVHQLGERVVRLLDEAVRAMSRIIDQSERAEIAEAHRYVEMNLHRKIGLNEAARHLHLNPSYFSRLFKKETGESFIEYVTRRKMEKAKELMDASSYPVHQIAEMLGYDNKSYFVKLFRQYTGMTPIEYIGRVRVKPPLRRSSV